MHQNEAFALDWLTSRTTSPNNAAAICICLSAERPKQNRARTCRRPRFLGHASTDSGKQHRLYFVLASKQEGKGRRRLKNVSNRNFSVSLEKEPEILTGLIREINFQVRTSHLQFRRKTGILGFGTFSGRPLRRRPLKVGFRLSR